MNHEVIKAVAKCEEELALAFVTAVKGSSPARVGTKMMIDKSGNIVGTLGGGKLEAFAIDTIKECIKNKSCRTINIDMMGEDILGQRLVCGGIVDAWIEYIEKPTIYQKALKRLDSGDATIIISDIKDNKGYIASVSPEGEILDGEERAFDKEAISMAFKAGKALFNEKDKLFYDIVAPADKLLILGGGHIGKEVARLATEVDFEVFIGDYRPEFSSPERYPEGVKCLTGSFPDIIKNFNFDTSTYVVIVTPNHLNDFECAEGVFKKDKFKYVGLIGSKRKVGMIIDKLKEYNYPKEIIENIFAPIGLDIGAITPKEIAFSIISEMIAVRRNAYLLDDSIKDRKSRRR